MTHAVDDTAIPFVDAHIHLWDLARLRYPWLTPPFADDGPNGSVEPIASTYLPADYRREMARWNVVGAVHVDAGADPADALAETEWLEGLAEADGLPTGIVAFARELAEREIPVVPSRAIDGKTLHAFGEYRFAVKLDECVNLRLECVDALEQCVDDVDRRQFAFRVRSRDFSRGQPVQVAHF